MDWIGGVTDKGDKVGACLFAGSEAIMESMLKVDARFRSETNISDVDLYAMRLSIWYIYDLSYWWSVM